MQFYQRIDYKQRHYHHEYRGQDGYGFMQGLYVIGETGTNDIALMPIDSRGFVGSCRIEVPRDKLDEIIDTLQMIREDIELEEQLERQKTG